MNELEQKLDGRRVVASISGGKDSAAMSLHLTELGVEHDRVFMDTGWEHPITYDYLRGPLTAKIGPITEICGGHQMVDLIRHKGTFPGRLRRFCTQELKVFPIKKYLASLDDDAINAVGIRGTESSARARQSEWEWSDRFDCEIWRPIIAWSTRDVIAIHRRHGLHPNPLYLMGASRVGCWPCIFARKSEIRLLADTDPKRIDLIRSLEAEVGDAMVARAAAKGKALVCRPAWFVSRLGRRSVDPIDKVVEWSRTARGGKQLELYAPSPGDEGCAQWELCESGMGETDDDAWGGEA